MDLGFILTKSPELAMSNSGKMTKDAFLFSFSVKFEWSVFYNE